MGPKDTNKDNDLIRTSVQLSIELSDRVKKYLKSPSAVTKTKRDLIELSLRQLLDREELVIREIEAQSERIRDRVRHL